MSENNQNNTQNKNIDAVEIIDKSIKTIAKGVGAFFVYDLLKKAIEKKKPGKFALITAAMISASSLTTLWMNQNYQLKLLQTYNKAKQDSTLISQGKAPTDYVCISDIGKFYIPRDSISAIIKNTREDARQGYVPETRLENLVSRDTSNYFVSKEIVDNKYISKDSCNILLSSKDEQINNLKTQLSRKKENEIHKIPAQKNTNYTVNTILAMFYLGVIGTGAYALKRKICGRSDRLYSETSETFPREKFRTEPIGERMTPRTDNYILRG